MVKSKCHTHSQKEKHTQSTRTQDQSYCNNTQHDTNSRQSPVDIASLAINRGNQLAMQGSFRGGSQETRLVCKLPKSNFLKVFVCMQLTQHPLVRNALR